MKTREQINKEDEEAHREGMFAEYSANVEYSAKYLRYGTRAG